ncbi:MAG: 30S ribosomal protein S7 [Leptospiraceae bacterium]|nr:30S ribosomal protein S7 [Leptospiraceae bacterium]MDW7975167.1 30S ribosomal protein S7 [Leptospiraceae bacterium]
MARRKLNIKRRIPPPDPVYGDVLVSKFINIMMKRGKKSVSEKIFYKAMELIKQKTGEEGIEIWRQAVENAKPELEVKSRRVGGVTYQVPVEVPPHRQESLAMRWIIKSARERKGKSMIEKLANEIIDAKNNTGGAIKKKEETRKMAEANRAFSHYRW